MSLTYIETEPFMLKKRSLSQKGEFILSAKEDSCI